MDDVPPIEREAEPRSGTPPTPRPRSGRRVAALPELAEWARRHPLTSILIVSLLALGGHWLFRQIQARNKVIGTLEAHQEELVGALQAAEAGRRREAGGTLLALAHVEGGRKPALALHLAVEGAKLRPGRVASDTLTLALERHHEARRLYAHDGPLAGFDLHEEVGRLLTWDRTGLLLVWDLRTGEVLARRVVPGGGIRGAVLRRQDEVVAACRDGKLRVWAADASAYEPRTSRVADVGLTAIAVTGYGVLVGTEDGAVLLLEPDDESSPPRTLAKHDSAIEALAEGVDAEAAVLDAGGGVVRYDLRWGKETWRATLDPPGDASRLTQRGRLAYAAKGKALVASSAFGVLAAWTGDADMIRLGGAKTPCMGWAVAKDAPRLVCEAQQASGPGGGAAVVLVFDLIERKMIQRFLGMPRVTHAVPMAIDRNGRTIAWAIGRNGPVVVRDLEEGQEAARLSGHDAPIGAMAFFASGRGLLTASVDRTVRLWEASQWGATEDAWWPGPAWAAGRWRGPFPTPGEDPGSEAATPKEILAVSSNLHYAWVKGTGAASSVEGDLIDQAGTLVSTPGVRASRATFSASGDVVAALDSEGRPHVFPVTSGEAAWHPATTARATALALSPSGKRLAVALEDGRIQVFERDRPDGKPVGETNATPLTSLAIAEGPRIVGLTPEGKLQLFRLGSDAKIEVEHDVPDGASQVAITPDGERIVVRSPHVVQVRGGVDLSVLARRVFPERTLASVSMGAKGAGVTLLAADGTFTRWPLDPLALAEARLPSPIHPQDLIRLEIGTPEGIHDAGNKVVDHQPSAKNLYGLGRARLQSGRLDEAQQRFEQAQDLRPDLAVGAYGLALVDTARMAMSLNGTEAWKKARAAAGEHLERALRAKPVPKQELLADPLLEDFRKLPAFQSLLEKHYPTEAPPPGIGDVEGSDGKGEGD